MEKWKEIIFDKGICDNGEWQVSNLGNLQKWNEDLEVWEYRKGGNLKGYPSIQLKTPKGTSTQRLIHRLMAEVFIPNNDMSKKWVIHLDYNKKNNHLSNLKWVNHKERYEHMFNDPQYDREKGSYTGFGKKLNEGRVKIIKKMLKNPKNKIKVIAAQFGVSTMQVNRIQRGENWAHVTID